MTKMLVLELLVSAQIHQFGRLLVTPNLSCSMFT